MSVDTSPEWEAARAYMAHKGYPDVEPLSIDHIENSLCWYFVYELPEGLLELETEYADGEWKWEVTSFRDWNELGDRRAG